MRKRTASGFKLKARFAVERTRLPSLERVLVVAHHLDVPAERDQGQAVLRLLPPVAKEDGAEADREALNPHARHPRHDEVTELVHQNENAQDQHERDDRRHANASYLTWWRRRPAQGRAATLHDPPGLGVDVHAGVDTIQWAVGHTAQRLGNERGNPGEPDLSGEESGHRHLVGGVQDGGAPSRPRARGLGAELEAGEALACRAARSASGPTASDRAGPAGPGSRSG